MVRLGAVRLGSVRMRFGSGMVGLGKVGFRLEKLYKLRLRNQSFWRIIYHRKYPDVPLLNHEYILVARKT